MNALPTIGVLGAGGFIGRRLIERLNGSGASLSAMVRRAQSGFPEAVSILERNFDQPADFEQGLAGIDVLVHVAASNTVTTSRSAPTKELDQDLRTTVSLIAALQQQPTLHLIYVSSGGTVYGECGTDEPIRERLATNPKSFHGAGKCAAEAFLLAWAQQRCGSLTILRPSNIYGPGQRPRPGFGVVPALFQSIRLGKPFTVRGSKTSMRDYLYVEDFVELVERVIFKNPPSKPLIVNASSGVGVQLGTLIDLASDAAGRAVVEEVQPSISADVNHIVLDASRAERQFGWKAKTSLVDGLCSTWNWFKFLPKSDLG